MSTTVFVSGASGFIAQHVIKQLLAKNYTVIGSVRSEAKGENLKKLFNNSAFSYVVVPDISHSGAFDETLKSHPEIKIFLHTASPFHFKVTDVEKELLTPAIDGTVNALKSVKKYGSNVTNVVVTSSYAAASTPATDADPNTLVSEDTWNLITKEQAIQDPISGYWGSKAFAERAAWKFVEDEKPNFSLTTVLPSYVFGPQAFGSEIKQDLNTSSEVINNLLKLGPEGEFYNLKGAHIDVRDVATAHITAFENKQASGQRILVAGARYSVQQLLDILNANFPQLKGTIPVGKAGSESSASLEKELSRLQNDKSKKLTGPWINLETSVVDSVQQILDAKA